MRAGLLLSLFAAFTLLGSGCGPKAPVDKRTFGKITGVVKLKGMPVGQEGLMLSFLPVGGQKPTNATVKADGTYACEAVVGVNKVQVVPSVGADGQYVDPKKMGIVAKYLSEMDTSLTADIKPVDDNKADFEIGM
jgi:hypothetical protein